VRGGTNQDANTVHSLSRDTTTASAGLLHLYQKINQGSDVKNPERNVRGIKDEGLFCDSRTHSQSKSGKIHNQHIFINMTTSLIEP
jgi:hypothetical protein